MGTEGIKIHGYRYCTLWMDANDFKAVKDVKDAKDPALASNPGLTNPVPTTGDLQIPKE